MNPQVDNDMSFHMGELFDSYEDLEKKLEKFSKQSLVHYWRRDSRTVNGAHMKTARPISEKLKYYSVKYACIYGGQKFHPRGAGRRNSVSIRTNCPAHIMLRASKDGNKLEVTSVNYEHNHPISEELFKKLPQERKLSGEIKQEVQDMMHLHIDRKRVKEYVRLRTNKILRSKDLFNIAAANKQKRTVPQARAYELYQRMRELEKAHEESNDASRKACSESEDEVSQKLKRIKRDESDSPWGPEGLHSEMEIIESNDGVDCYEQLEQEVANDMETTEGQLLGTTDHNDIIGPDGEIVGEMVMEGDQSVIVDSIVNVDGSSTVYVDEQAFTNYCNNHLVNPADEDDDDVDRSPISDGLDIGMINTGVDIDDMSKASSSSPQCSDPLARNKVKVSRREIVQPRKIWLLKGPNQDNEEESDTNNAKLNDVSPEVDDDVAEDRQQRLFAEQLSVLQAEKEKLLLETEVLKLKKEKMKLEMASHVENQRMHKEKVRLQIELLKAKVVDIDDNTHFIIVPPR